ncbi:MAG TPA: ATP-dependent Clp protease proteolytic subunit [Candidatus Limnocylindrales bacterium]
MLRIPYVFEETPYGARQVDIYSRLLSNRIVLLTGEINDDVADILVAQLFYLESVDREKDIYLYINSPGGVVTAGLAVYDVMQFVSCDISTVCLGQAASMGAVLLTAGTEGKRMALPHARVLIHQPLGGAQGQASDVEIQANEMIRIKGLLNDILSRHTGQPLETIRQDTDRDRFLTAADAKKYGLIDRVVEHRPR